MKVIIIGTSLSGKTTLARYLRSKSNVSVEEMDEKLSEANKGTYPGDEKRKKKLASQIVKDILDRDDEIIFLTNTDYFTENDLQTARAKGFKIVQLSLNLEEMRKRNTERVQREGYDDLSQWFEGMLRYQEKITGLIDQVIDANQPVDKIANDLGF